jgi:hypothetical protein
MLAQSRAAGSRDVAGVDPFEQMRVTFVLRIERAQSLSVRRPPRSTEWFVALPITRA